MAVAIFIIMAIFIVIAMFIISKFTIKGIMIIILMIIMIGAGAFCSVCKSLFLDCSGDPL